MDKIKSGAAVAEPGDDKESSKSDHEDGDDLAPKATWEFVLDGSFFFSATFGRFSFFGHIL